MVEVGSSSFGLLNIKLPPVSFESATIWSSIGFAGGSILGAAIAARDLGKRAFLLTGEGSYMGPSRFLVDVESRLIMASRNHSGFGYSHSQ
jgi:TPP-dependent 2-oxoacid decarboxylase